MNLKVKGKNNYTLTADCMPAKSYDLPIEASLTKGKMGVTKAGLMRLFEWAESKKMVPSTVLTKKQAAEFNRQERWLRMLYNVSPNKWKVGDKYYSMIVPIDRVRPIPVRRKG